MFYRNSPSEIFVFASQKRFGNTFIEYEADDDDEGLCGNESTFVDGYVMDSFIDDATQETPIRSKKCSKTSKRGNK